MSSKIQLWWKWCSCIFSYAYLQTAISAHYGGIGSLPSITLLAQIVGWIVLNFPSKCLEKLAHMLCGVSLLCQRITPCSRPQWNKLSVFDIVVPCYLMLMTYISCLTEHRSCSKVEPFRHIMEERHVVMQRWGRSMTPQSWCVGLVVMCQEPRCVLSMAQIS